MENFTQHINNALPTVEKEAKGPERNHERPTHLSLPKLVIKPYKGPKPMQIPTAQVDHFIEVVAAHAPEPVALLPLPVSPASLIRASYPQRNRENPDPYLVDLPTPATLQFTENEVEELMQWKLIVGDMRDAHGKALDQLMDNPRDTELRAEVRKLRTEREKNAAAIAQINERRQIRKAFRRDFNEISLGW